MADKSPFLFDPEKMMDYFRSNEFTRAFTEGKLPAFDAEALMATQQKNMDALMEANRAAAAGYQDLFRKQLAIFEETIEAARAQIGDMDLKIDSAAAQKRSELAKAAFEKAIGHMRELAETAHKANTEAYEIVSARARASMDELRAMTEKKG